MTSCILRFHLSHYVSMLDALQLLLQILPRPARGFSALPLPR